MGLLPTTSQLKIPAIPKPPQNPNAFLRPSPGRPRASLPFGCPRSPPALRCSSSGHDDRDPEPVLRPRPREIPWSRELANSVHLIGIVGAPVQIKYLSGEKALAWTRLGVWKSASETTWVSLTFWDDLAHLASQHVEKGHQVYVSGRLVSDVVGGEDEDRKVYYKVVVQKLNFVKRSFPTASLYGSESKPVASEES